MFSFAIPDKLFVNQSPKILNSGGFQDTFRWGSSFSAHFLLLPIQMSQAFSKFSFSPDILWNSLRTPKSFSYDLLSPSKISEVSSANWLILNLLSKICMPFISLASLILHASTSAQRMKKYGEIWSPCDSHVLLESSKKLYRWQLLTNECLCKRTSIDRCFLQNHMLLILYVCITN